MTTCKGITKSGKPCKRRPAADASYCSAHRPEPVVEHGSVPAVDALVQEHDRIERGEQPSPFGQLEAAVYQMAQLLAQHAEQQKHILATLQEERQLVRERMDAADRRQAKFEKQIARQIDVANAQADAVTPEVKARAKAALSAKLQQEVVNQGAQRAADQLAVRAKLERELKEHPVLIYHDREEMLMLNGVAFRLVLGQQKVPGSVAQHLAWRRQLQNAERAMSNAIAAGASDAGGPATRPGEHVPRALVEAEREHGLGISREPTHGFDALGSIPVAPEV